MPSYSTLSRFSRIQLESEERKQQAHLRKISEMQSHSGLDNRAPRRYPHLHQAFLKQLNEKRQGIDKENELKSKKLLDIMTSRSSRSPSPPTSHPKNQMRRIHTVHTSQNNTEYFERVAKAKGKYDAHEWRKEYEQHKEHLKLRKNNKVFTPLDIGPNRHRNNKTILLTDSTPT
jgi:hypothetical protein